MKKSMYKSVFKLLCSFVIIPFFLSAMQQSPSDADEPEFTSQIPASVADHQSQPEPHSFSPGAASPLTRASSVSSVSSAHDGEPAVGSPLEDQIEGSVLRTRQQSARAPEAKAEQGFLADLEGDEFDQDDCKAESTSGEPDEFAGVGGDELYLARMSTDKCYQELMNYLYQKFDGKEAPQIKEDGEDDPFSGALVSGNSGMHNQQRFDILQWAGSRADEGSVVALYFVLRNYEKMLSPSFFGPTPMYGQDQIRDMLLKSLLFLQRIAVDCLMVYLLSSELQAEKVRQQYILFKDKLIHWLQPHIIKYGYHCPYKLAMQKSAQQFKAWNKVPFNEAAWTFQATPRWLTWGVDFFPVSKEFSADQANRGWLSKAGNGLMIPLRIFENVEKPSALRVFVQSYVLKKFLAYESWDNFCSEHNDFTVEEMSTVRSDFLVKAIASFQIGDEE